MRIIISIFFLFCIYLNSNAIGEDSITNNIFNLVYNQQFNEAESKLSENHEHLDAFYYDVLMIDLNWWKYSSSRLKKDAKNLTDLLDDYIESTVNSEDKIMLLICKSYQLRYERKRYNIIGTVRLRSEINELLTELNRNELSISGDELKLFDLFMALFQYFEHVNPFSIWSKTPERTEQLIQMEEFAKEKNLIVNTMAHYFLGRIYQKVEREPQKGKTHFQFLSRKFPGNELFKDHLEDCEQKL